MPKVNILNQLGEVIGEMDLSDELFNVDVNDHAVYTVVKNHLANLRQGTQSAKTRGEVRGGGRKPFRQKGTGNARQGSRRAPNMPGGGIVFPPKPRDYSYHVPKKVRRLAMKSALTDKVRAEELLVLDKLDFDAYSTKKAAQVLQALKAPKKAYIVLDDTDEKVIGSFRNLEGVDTCLVQNMNVYDLLAHDSLIMTQAAVKKAEEVFQ